MPAIRASHVAAQRLAREAVARPELRQRAAELVTRDRPYARKPEHERRRVYRLRPCIACRETFRSQGPHNRQCPTCRRRPDSPYENPMPTRHVHGGHHPADGE